jgi:hypothetical protein
MANNPSKPSSDGGGAVGTLATYADWTYAGGTEPDAPAGVVVDPDPLAATAATATPNVAAVDWADWVARKLEHALQARLSETLPPARRDALVRALDKVKGWR